MLDAQLQANALAKLQTTFDEYARVNKRDLDELLQRKGRDLGIKLYQGYRAKREGRGYAVRELRARTRVGKGTRVRDKVLNEKWTRKIPRFFPIRGRGRSRSQAHAAFLGRRLTRQQLLVGQEIIRREAGRGALAASFLWFRRRTSQARGTYYVKNRLARVLGQVDSDTTNFRIRGYQGGLAVVDARYGIVRGAIQRSDDDMQAYIAKKQREAAEKHFPPRITA